MQLLFHLFDARQGSVTIKGDEWTYATGLKGDGGEVLDDGNRLAILLDNSGNGVASASEQPPQPPSGKSIYEAEDASTSSAFEIGKNHPGYTGAGFVDYVGEGHLTWSVRAPTAGTYDLIFRYALGTGNRPLAILVDGSSVATALAFPRTGSWASWNVVTVTTRLSAGAHSIRAQTAGRSGGNMDHLSVLRNN